VYLKKSCTVISRFLSGWPGGARTTQKGCRLGIFLGSQLGRRSEIHCCGCWLGGAGFPFLPLASQGSDVLQSVGAYGEGRQQEILGN